jgi:hypothetical protein
MSPLLTLEVHDALRAAARAALASVGCSLDLQWSTTTVEVGADDLPMDADGVRTGGTF